MMSVVNLETDVTIRGFREGQRVFGRYTLLRVLGRGGMGVVWLARDEELERLTAIKFLPELIMTDAEALRDLKRETRRNLDITHANIVRIYDFEQDAAGAGIMMEYVEGDTLGALKVKSPTGCLDAETVAPWLVQICDALHYAHTKPKVAHRDLKPANIMLQKDGEIKVTDFGIASSISDTVSRVSMRAGSSGTPVFMSPQQALGQRPTARDDIYSLGATIYDLLTGKPPFYTGELMYQLAHVAPPLMRDRRAELEKNGMPIPDAWEEVVAACLAKDPTQRPSSVKEVGERLASAWPKEPAAPIPVTVTGDKPVQKLREAGTPEVARDAGGERDRHGRWVKWAWPLVAIGIVLGWVAVDRPSPELKEERPTEVVPNGKSQPTVVSEEKRRQQSAAEAEAREKAENERLASEAAEEARLEMGRKQREARLAEEKAHLERRREQEVLEFFQTVWGHQTSNSEEVWAMDFADSVRYCYSDEQPVDRDFLRMDRAKLIRDWPIREYRLRGHEPLEFVGSEGCLFRYTFDYEYRNSRGKKVAGVSAMRLELSKLQGTWKVVAYDEIVKRSEGK